MKNFWLFGGECHYATGGFNDFLDAFDTIESAVSTGNESLDPHWGDCVSWYHVLNVEKMAIVASEGVPYGMPQPD